jgi:hypothetical protein
MVIKLKLAILVLGIIQIGPLIIVSPLVVWSWTTIATGPALASGTAGYTPSVCTIVPLTREINHTVGGHYLSFDPSASRRFTIATAIQPKSAKPSTFGRSMSSAAPAISSLDKVKPTALREFGFEQESRFDRNRHNERRLREFYRFCDIELRHGAKLLGATIQIRRPGHLQD